MAPSPAVKKEGRTDFDAARPLFERKTPFEAAKEGSQKFIRLLEWDDTAGVVSVDGGVDAIPMREMSVENQSQSLSEIPRFRAWGGTGWAKLLKESFQQIAESDNRQGFTPVGNEVVVLISDGSQDTDAVSEDLISRIKDRGVVVHAIGIGDETAELRQVATRTGGNYLFARSTPDVNADLMMLLAEIKDRGVIEAREGNLGPGETLVVPVRVDPATTTETADFLLTWSDPGEGLAMKLVGPDGTEVSPDVPRTGLQDDFERRLKRYRVLSPKPGEWKVSIFNTGSSGGDFAFQVHSLSDAVTVAAYAEDDVVVQPAPLVLKAVVATDYPVAGAKVTAWVERPDGERVAVELFDDGDVGHRDERANDGAYSNVFRDYKDSGSYNVDVSVDSSENGHTVSPEVLNRTFVSKHVERFVRKVRFSVVVQQPRAPIP